MIDNICQNVDCENIGREVKVSLHMEDGTDRTEDIFLCRICINLQNALSGGLKN